MIGKKSSDFRFITVMISVFLGSPRLLILRQIFRRLAKEYFYVNAHSLLEALYYMPIAHLRQCPQAA